MPDKITHYALLNKGNFRTIFIKEAEFFESQGGLTKEWGKNWVPITDANTIGDARRKAAKKWGVDLPVHIYGVEV